MFLFPNPLPSAASDCRYSYGNYNLHPGDRPIGLQDVVGYLDTYSYDVGFVLTRKKIEALLAAQPAQSSRGVFPFSAIDFDAPTRPGVQTCRACADYTLYLQVERL